MMPIIESAITVQKDAKEIYSLLKDMEAFPRFIAGVERIKVKRLSRDRVVSEWSIDIKGTKVKWKEQDTFDDKSLTIAFRMTEGDFASYSGSWNVLENGSSARLSFMLSIDWELHHLREEIIPELERKARLAARWMLREIKSGVGPKRILSQQVTSSELSTAIPETAVVSELVTYSNRQGKRIVGFLDHPREMTGNEPIVVVPPGYGETKRDALTVAYYLVRNGFRAIRYDATDHLGESEGEITTTTMAKLQGDLASTVDHVERTFGVKRVGVIASSLATRMAIKAAAEDPRIEFLLGVVGVVNLQETLKAIYQEDIIGDVAGGRVKDFYDVLGFNIDKEYPISAIRDRYHDLESTVRDMRDVKIPVVFLVAEKDAWVKLDDVRLVVESSQSSPRDLHLIPEAMHQLFENPRAARTALKQTVVSAMKYLYGKATKLEEVIEPNLRELARQNQLEKQRLGALTRITPEGERQFWAEYLSSYLMLSKVPDYRRYLSLIQELLGDIRDGDVLLDAGCGVGYFGAWLIAALFNRQKKTGVKFPAFRYIGLDFVESALRQSKAQHDQIVARCLAEQRGAGGKGIPVEFVYLLGDLNELLSLPDGSVDKICCSLVLSYLKEPLLCARELMRVLRPGGQLVVTSLKPYPDLSQIYRNFITQAETEQDILEARRLLSNAGQIRQKEGEGHYSFYSEKELTALMVAIGGEKVKAQRSFGNQANVAVASKPLKTRLVTRR